MQQNNSPKTLRIAGIILIVTSVLPIGLGVFFYFHLTGDSDQSQPARLIIPAVMLVTALIDIIAGILFVRFSSIRQQSNEETDQQEKIGPWQIKK